MQFLPDRGFFSFSGKLPHGAYTIRELDGPKGWKLNPNRFDVRISPENQADDAPVIRVSLDGTVRNELIYTKVTLTKTDITGAETVPGAEIDRATGRHGLLGVDHDVLEDLPDLAPIVVAEP